MSLCKFITAALGNWSTCLTTKQTHRQNFSQQLKWWTGPWGRWVCPRVRKGAVWIHTWNANRKTNKDAGKLLKKVCLKPQPVTDKYGGLLFWARRSLFYGEHSTEILEQWIDILRCWTFAFRLPAGSQRKKGVLWAYKSRLQACVLKRNLNFESC